MQREKKHGSWKQGIQELGDNQKKGNIYAMGIWGGKEREKGTEEMFEVIMDAKFSKLMTENKSQDQKFPRIPNKINILK